MIKAIQNIKAIEAILAKAAVAQFNGTLPTSVQVLKDISSTSLVDPFRYLLKLGNKTLETKSQTPLDVGTNYWGRLTETQEGAIHLSKLTKKPSLLQLPPEILKELPALSIGDFTLHLKEKKPKESLKQFILEALASAPNKQTFLYLTSILLGFSQEIATLLLEDSQKRKVMVQYKQRKKEEQGLTHFVVEFYSAMPNLGPINGQISSYKDGNGHSMQLSLFAEFENSAQFLSEELKNLRSFSHTSVVHKTGITELYPLSDRLLNLQA